MALAHSIFTLDGGFQLFWAAFDMPVTVVPLKVALGLQKFDFWAFKKNNKKMVLAHSIFTLGGRVQLFWTAFDMPVTGVPLEVALGW